MSEDGYSFHRMLKLSFILHQLERILHPSFNNINIRWTCPSENNPIQFIIPIHPPNVLFSETRFLVYALLDGTNALDQKIKIESIEDKKPREHCLATVGIDRVPQIGYEQGKIITRLATKALIQDLLVSENENNDEEQKWMLDIQLVHVFQQ